MTSYLPWALQEATQVSPQQAAQYHNKVGDALAAHVSPMTVKMGNELKTSFVEWRGEGIHVYSPDGDRRFDCVGAGGVFGLGFAHPALVEAVTEQAKRGGLSTRVGFVPNQAELAEKLAGAKVLKAFNTNFAATLASGTTGGVTTAVLVAGDDADAKSALSSVVTGGGLRVIDAGPLKRAHELEAIGAVQIGLAVTGQTPWTGGFAIVE